MYVCYNRSHLYLLHIVPTSAVVSAEVGVTCQGMVYGSHLWVPWWEYGGSYAHAVEYSAVLTVQVMAG